MKRLILIALGLVMLLVFTGCGKAPDAQLKAATAALQAAEDAGAPRYAPEAWNRAKQALDKMKAELDKQSKKSLFRNYGKVKSLADEATRFAKQALTDTNTKKTQLTNEVTGMIADLGAQLKSARDQLSRLPRVRTLDTAAQRSTLNSAGVQLDQARANLAAGALDSAMAAASQARDGITKVLKAIEKATGKPTSPKR